MKAFSIMIFSIAFVATAYAWEPNDNARLYGAGNLSCGDFVKDRREAHRPHIIQYSQWLAGYFTAVSMYNPEANNKDFFGGKSMEGSLLYLENYCTDNPLKIFFEAVQALQKELLPPKNK